MTLEEARNQISVSHGEKDFNSVFHGYKGKHYMYLIMNEAAELYARSKWEEAIEAQRQELIKLFDKAGGTLSSYYTMKELNTPKF